MSTQRTEHTEQTPKILSQLCLPNNNYKLYRWKYTDGSHIRVGDAIVDLCPTNFAINNNKATKHKRPNRKRRLKPPPPSQPSTESDKSVDPNTNNTESSTTVSTQPTDRPTAEAVETTTTTTTTTTTATTPTDPKSILTIHADVDGILRIGPPPPTKQIQPQQQNNAIFGYIEECQHPTVLEGMCAVCGATLETTTKSTHNNNSSSQQSKTPITASPTNKATSHLTVAGFTVQVSKAEGERMAAQDAARLTKLRKLSLVLDLDHTLVHATDDPRAALHQQSRTDVRSLILAVPSPQQPGMWFHQQHFVKLRPHVKEFLEAVMDQYEVQVYTAGTREYAEQVVIILSRHLVGAQRDQADLEDLKRRVFQAERRLAAGKQQRNGIVGMQNTSGKDSQDSQSKGNDVEAATVGQKRKRVTFGDAPASAKSDETTQEDVDRLKAELVAAEKLENEALAMRQKLFGNRVVSRTDVGDLGRDVKSLQRIFPCGGSMAAVVDDREDVWANAEEMKAKQRGEPPQNLLLVRPYRWASFLGMADVNNASGVDLTGQDTSDGTDRQLLWTADILKRLHDRYYKSSVPTTVPDTLETMRKEVLAGCRLVFSGIIPLHKQKLGPNVPREPLVRYAESLGATILNTVTKSTTHVVAAKDGTDKVLAARRIEGCRIVQASWLMECMHSVSRRDESAHFLNGKPARPDAKMPARRLTPEDAFTTTTTSRDIQILADSTRDNSSSSSDEDDEEFAASLENELMGDSPDAGS